MDNTGLASPSKVSVPKKPKYLIAFNKFKKITFFGTCKVEIDVQNHRLTFQTNATEEKFKEFVSTFNRIFVQKENALCIIDAISNKDFIVIFPLKSTCERIIEEINKVKFPSGPPTADPATDDYLFKNNFYIPILKEVQAKATGFMEIKTVLLDLVNKFEPDQRQSYMNTVFEILLSSADDSINDSTINGNGTVMNKNDEKNVSLTNDNYVTLNLTNNQCLNETTSSSGYSFRKRLAINDSSINSPSYVSFHESNFGSSASKKSKKSSAADDSETLDATRSSHNEIVTASYEFVECFRKGALRKQILLFSSYEKNECYEFYYSNSDGWHACKGCSQMKQSTSIKIISIENGKMEFKKGRNQHICQPIKYSSGDYKTQELCLEDLKLLNKPKKSLQLKTIKLPDYKIIQQKYGEKICSRLIIFDIKDRNFCYEYGYHTSTNRYRCSKCSKEFNRYVFAKLIKNEKGDDILELGPAEHLCKLKIFDHEKGEVVSTCSSTSKETPQLRRIQKPNFQIEMVPNYHNRKESVTRLTICDSAYGNKSFLYYFNHTNKCYYCKNCMHKCNKFVSAKLMEDENGEEYIGVSDVKHVCL